MHGDALPFTVPAARPVIYRDLTTAAGIASAGALML